MSSIILSFRLTVYFHTIFSQMVPQKEFHDSRHTDSAHPFRLIFKMIKQKLKKWLAI